MWLFRRNKVTGFKEIEVTKEDILRVVTIPDATLDEKLAEYFKAMETGVTDDWCLCTWIIHPDDVNKPKGKRRKRLVEHHPRCPAHTKEGLVLGFIRWVSKDHGSNR